MKPVIIDMKDMSDSTEVYESRPNSFFIYTIYLILLLLITAFLWMSFSKMDIVVKSNGMFRCDEAMYEVSSQITGKVKNCNIRDGQMVQEGDILFVLEIDSIDENIKSYRNKLDHVKQRLAILKAYEKSLDGNSKSLDLQSKNSYYEEFINRRKLFFFNMDSNSQNIEKKVDSYQKNINVISSLIDQYRIKKKKLKKAAECITIKKNRFRKTESYYYSTVGSYLSNYYLTASKYDIQINEYRKQVDEYCKFLKKLKSGKISQSEMNSSELEKEKDTAQEKIDSLKKEKKQALENLELQQIFSLEQQIENVNDTILSLQSNFTSVRLQLEVAENGTSSVEEDIQILTEKGNIADEILSYQSKKEEYENYLKNYDIQKNNCNVVAGMTGYFYLQKEVKQGAYIQEGACIGKIYPEKPEEYYVEVYVENEDVAKLEVGQAVKFDIAAYPCSEYGYFTGKIIDISKDITIDQNTGGVYYLVKASSDQVVVKNKSGKSGRIINGMMCQAKIIVEAKSILEYFLEKIDLID